MRSVKLYDYYSFGFNYELLLNESKNKSVEGFNTDLENYMAFITNHSLKVTISCLTLQGIEDDLKKLEKLNKGAKKKKPLPSELCNSIISKIKMTDSTLDAELNIEEAFLLDEKRFSNKILVGNIEKVFSSGVFFSLPNIAQFDFKECGKCLAYDRFTAAAFHSLRGTEDTLRFYYSKILNKVPSERQTWGNFHTEINKENQAGSITPKIHEEILINLENLRKYYRNKTQHPQLMYSVDEVQDLFFSCINVVNAMIKDLINRKVVFDLPF